MSGGLLFGAALHAVDSAEFKSFDDEDEETGQNFSGSVSAGISAGAAGAASAPAAAPAVDIVLQRTRRVCGPYQTGPKAKKRKMDALQAMREGASRAAAAQAFGVAAQTLGDAQRCGGERRPPGRPPAHPEVEELLVKWMTLSASLGWPQTRRSIELKAAQLAHASGNPFKGPLLAGVPQPSRHWWVAFKRRHRDAFRMRQANKRRYVQALAATRSNLDAFYKLLGEQIDELKKVLPPEVDVATRIWNADETGLDRLGSGKGQVAVPVDMKQPDILQSDWKEHVSVMTAIRADGLPMVPMFIFLGTEGVRQKFDYLAGIDVKHGVLSTQTGETLFAFPCCSLF